MMKFKITVCLFFSLLLLTTCTSDVYSPDVCFQENVLPIFVTHCSMAGCHNSTDYKAGYDLSNYDGIMKGVTKKHPNQSEVYTVVKGNNPSMPIGSTPKLTQREVTYIKLWIQSGAANSSNCFSCDTSHVTFSGKIQPLINTWCVGCHNTASPGGGYDFSSYTGIVVSITDGRLLGTLQHTSGFSPMPKNSAQLSSCDIATVQKWINSGYPNN